MYQLSTSLWLISMDTIWSISMSFHEGTQRGVPISNLGYTYNCIHINRKKILLMENTFGHDPRNTRENILLICILVFFFAKQIDVGYELIKKMINDICSENSHTCFIANFFDHMSPLDQKPMCIAYWLCMGPKLMPLRYILIAMLFKNFKNASNEPNVDICTKLLHLEFSKLIELVCMSKLYMP